MTLTCTIIKNGRHDEYGRPLAVGQFYKGDGDFVKSLFQAGYCTLPNFVLLDAEKFANIPEETTLSVETNNVTGEIGFNYATGRSGYRTVLFGDSMVDTYETIATPSALSYDKGTGILTVTSTGHQQATGWYVTFFHRAFPALMKQKMLKVSVIDANTFSINVGENLQGVPNGAVSASGSMYRPQSWRSAQGFVTWLNLYSAQRFNIVYNGGQSGDTAEQTFMRIDENVLVHSPQVVICQMPGINDMSAGNGYIDEDTINFWRIEIVKKLSKYVDKVIVMTTTPVYTGEARATARNATRLVSLNRRLMEFCRGIPNVIFFDAYAQVVNPVSDTGVALANMLRTADNIHYSMRGSAKVAKALWNQVKDEFASLSSSLPVSIMDSYASARISMTSVTRLGDVVTATATAHGFVSGETVKVAGGSSEVLNDYVKITTVDANTVRFNSVGNDGAIPGTIYIGRGDNLFDNPLLATATGGTVVAGVTGVAANRIKVSYANGTPTAVASVVSRADGFGNDQQVVVTAIAANDQISIEADYSLAATEWPPAVKAGRSYVFECELSLQNVAGSNLTEIRSNIVSIVGGTTYQTYALNGYADGAGLDSDQSALFIRTAPLVLPPGAVTNFKFFMLFRMSAAGSALTIKVGRIALRES